MRPLFWILSFIPVFLVSFSIGLSEGRSFDESQTTPNNEEIIMEAGRRVGHDLATSEQELRSQMELVRSATATYIGAKIKENLFKALSTIPEKDLEEVIGSMQNRARQPRQDEDDDEETVTPEPGILPQLATILQSVFGQNVNVTKYVENASKLILPRPISNQLVGVVSLLDPNQFTSTSKPAETTEARVQQPVTPPPRVKPSPTTVVVTENENGTKSVTLAPSAGVVASSTPDAANLNDVSPAKTATTTPSTTSPSSSSTTTAEDATDEEDGDQASSSEREEGSDFDSDSFRHLGRRVRVKRQGFPIQGLHPMMLLEGLEAIWKNFGTSNDTAVVTPANNKATPGSKTPSGSGSKLITAKAGGSSTTESDDGFDDDYTTKPSRVNTAVKGAASQFDALRKGVPDLFQGAREAYKFLEHLNGFLDTWENRLQAGSADDE